MYYVIHNPIGLTNFRFHSSRIHKAKIKITKLKSDGDAYKNLKSNEIVQGRAMIVQRKSSVS